jgi:hypothetical protein
MMKLKLRMVMLFGLLGAVAPIAWIYEVLHGHYVGDSSAILDSLTRFFPSSILFLAIPYPMNWTGAVIVLTAVVLNMGLYSLGAYLVFSLLRVGVRMVGNNTNGDITRTP